MRTAAEYRLKLLESQLEPHMLFNTLANLRVLIVQDPERAQAMLDHLIGFLRATLEASRVGSHTLAAEFELLANYLALMQVRMGKRLSVGLRLPAELSSLSIPALLLQPLVENAIKHGLEPKLAGGRITVTARLDGETLLLTIRDTGIGLSAVPNAGRGFGMRQVRERLATVYGRAAMLDLHPALDVDGGAEVTLRLPAVAPAAPLIPALP
jgi:LytS/YehU family sensor histidine kinase